MALKFFEDGFDYKKYINDRLLDIDDIEERSQIRKAVADMLIPFYEHIEESYKSIEEKMFNSKNENKGNFQIITGIEERDRIDVTDLSMFPMCMEDMEEHNIPVEDLLNELKQNKPYKIYTVFMQADYSLIRKIEHTKRKFRAIVKTNCGEYPALVKLEKNNEYLNMIKELYLEFINNGIEWKTVCAPYLHKLFDVKIVSTECPYNEIIQKITVYFEEYEMYIKYNYVPLWNIRCLTMKTSAYPDFCMDRIHYEHCIFGTKLNDSSDYLVAGTKKLWNVVRRAGDMYIQCDEKSAVNWEIREFCYSAGTKQYELPLMKNDKSVSKRYIRTIAEAKGYVKELDCDKYIELKDINRNPHTQEDETYTCDEFIIDEIRKSEDSPVLYFEFDSCNKESILTRDMMSYVVSRLQLIYPEYNCKGVLV